MRLSVSKDDPAYGDPRTFDARVFLDGVEIKDCITADDETGECLCYKRTPDGGFAWNGAIETEFRRGKVEIRLPAST